MNTLLRRILWAVLFIPLFLFESKGNNCTPICAAKHETARFLRPLPDTLTVPLPINNGNRAICGGDSIPFLSVSTQAGLEPNWYDAPVGGNLLASNSAVFLPNGAGIFYVENYDPVNACPSGRIPVQLVVNPRPTVDAGDDQTNCAGICTDLNASGSGALFQWSNGENLPQTNVCPNETQLYFVTVTDFVGCTASDSVTVNMLQLPTPTSNGDQTICANLPLPTLSVTDIPGYQTNWYNDLNNGDLVLENAASLPAPYAGTFYAQYTDLSSGCTGKRTAVSVVVLPVPTATLVGNPNICAGNCTNLLSFGGDTYLWSTGESTSSIEICPDFETIYTVTVTNQEGCTDDSSMLISAVPTPQLTLVSVSCAPDLESYTVELTVMSAQNLVVSAGDIFSIGSQYSITNIPNNQSIVITANNGSALCQASLTTTPPNCNCPAISAPISNGNVAICSGAPIPPLSVQEIPQGMNLSIYWYRTAIGGAAILTNQNVLATSNPGTYYAEIIDTVTLCKSTRVSVRLSIDSVPVANAGPPVDINCNSGVAIIDGTKSSAAQGITYNWTTLNGHIVDGEHTLTPTVDSSGVYYLTASADPSGCASTDSVRVFRHFPPVGSVEVLNPKCDANKGEIRVKVTADGTPPFRYAITARPFTPDSVFRNVEPGNYSVVINDAFQCTWQDVATVASAPEYSLTLDSVLVLEFSEQKQIVPEFNFPESILDSVIWSPQMGLSCYDCLRPTTDLLESNWYYLTTIDTNGCVENARMTIQIKKTSVYAPNIIAPQSDNTENGIFTLYARETSVETVEMLRIFDRWGELVFENTDFPIGESSEGWSGNVRGKAALPGVYVWFAQVRLINGDVLKLKGEFGLMR